MRAMTGPAAQAGRAAVSRAVASGAQAMRPPPGPGDWLAGVALGVGGARRYRVYRPPGLQRGERVPLVVMLHGCGQDAKRFAMSTRMNRIAARERFLVLYPEQDRMANPQGCWNWYDTDSGRAYAEAGLVMRAIDQVCMLYPADRTRVALAGLSAGASMAALLALRHPTRFRAVVMHSGVPPGVAHSTMSALGAMRGRRPAATPAPAEHEPSEPSKQPKNSRQSERSHPPAHSGLPAGLPATAEPLPPLLVIHGGADRVVSVRNGHAAALHWAQAACAVGGTSRSVQRGKRHAMSVTDYRKGGRVAVRLVEIGRLGHAWSGGAARQAYSDAEGPDASRMAWAFMAAQFRV
jgi:poly(hydroxyalkanoate) depolymerase family esterase